MRDVHEWQDDAACRGDDDPGAWFAAPSEVARRDHAVRVCLGCPVRNECLETALREGLLGTWGGKSERERRSMKAKVSA